MLALNRETYYQNIELYYKKHSINARCLPLVIVGLCLVHMCKSQGLTPALRAGLTFSRIQGGTEHDDRGLPLETHLFTTGWHLSIGADIALINQFGLRAELLYNQKGTEYRYDGFSYWIFPTIDNERRYAAGTRRMLLSIRNTYLELPVLMYLRSGRATFVAGFSMGQLLRSKGTGELLFSGITTNGSPTPPFRVVLEFDYLRDPLQVPLWSDEVLLLPLDGVFVEVPIRMSAYYEATTRPERYFYRLDLASQIGADFNLSYNLFIGFRWSYSLRDVINDRQDVLRQRLDEQQRYVLRNAIQRYSVLQLSGGIKF